MANTIYQKLAIIQSKLKCNKSQYNSFGKYKYRNCEDILEAVKPLLNEVKATVIISDEIINISNRFYVKATARLIDIESGEHTETTAYAREEESKKGMDSSQVTGATSSYARKYALNGLFAIDDTKDSDYAPDPNQIPKKDPMIEIKIELNKLIAKYSEVSNKPIADISKELTEIVKVPLKQISMEQAKMLLTYIKGKIAKTDKE